VRELKLAELGGRQGRPLRRNI